MGRLLIVAHRLPVTLTHGPGATGIERSPGGLATGLSGYHSRSEALWIGWPGPAPAAGPDSVAAESIAARLDLQRLHPVWIDPEEHRGFYEGHSNGVLWPLFHYLLDRLPLHGSDFPAWQRVNALFADEIMRCYRPGDRIWVHDYQLMLVPGLVRERLPEATIGFFLHIPFPAAEIFRIVPQRERLLEGLLGADLVGFHTAGYMRSFVSSLQRVLGTTAGVDRVWTGSREVRLAVLPMGIDVAHVEQLAAAPAAWDLEREMKGDGAVRLLLAIDRLDYTKGLRRRLLAFEELLGRRPDLHGRVRLVQVAVPSREGVEAYQEFRTQVEALIGRINGVFGTPQWTPIRYVHRALPEAELVALYRAADAMLVTPLRDGLNLVAKEFVATRSDEGGVLVLSEFAGAASELAEALIVNPWDVDRAASVFERALAMGEAERRARMRALRRRVAAGDVASWAESFLATLDEAAACARVSARAPAPPEELAALVARMRATSRLVLLLGYDGTLVPLAAVPALSMPDEALVALLRALAQRPGTEIHVVSGSAFDLLGARLGELPIHLHAEYGFWHRPPGGPGWTSRDLPVLAWREAALEILRGFTSRTPGSLIEEKSVSLAWHYRWADLQYGAFQANELRVHLAQVLSNEPAEIVAGEKVVEIRPAGLHKGLVVEALDPAPAGDALVVAIGDDRTDEDLFAALPEDAISVHVGTGPSRAALRVISPEAVRGLLGALLRGAAVA